MLIRSRTAARFGRALACLGLAAAATTAGAAACGSFEEANDSGGDAAIDGALGPDGATNADGGADGSTSDGTAVEDASAPSADATPPDGMVPIPIPGSGGFFYIDALEVSAQDYTKFALAWATDHAVLDAGGCAYKPDVDPVANCFTAGGQTATSPQTCVDWCDAYLYCEWRGARLCGSTQGGSANPSLPATDEWGLACHGPGAQTFPYGSAADKSRCNTQDNPEGGAGDVRPSGSFPDCVGGYPGLYDMAGNVWEWIDQCAIQADGGTTCTIRGGSAADPAGATSCNNDQQHAYRTQLYNIGFRCCWP